MLSWRHEEMVLASKSKRPGSKLTLVAIILLSIILSTGCSVGMAMSGKKAKDTSILFIGAPREAVLTKLGPPETSVVNDSGDRVDTYIVTEGNEPSTGRAAMHAGLDVLSLGLWEVIGTPMEMGAGREENTRYIITYDPSNKIKDMKAIRGAAELKEK